MDYEKNLNEFFKKLGEARKLVLATCFNNKPTARMMSCIIINNDIYFQTDRNFIKYNQLLNNKNVALCIDNIQIEGIAEECGHPFNQENEQFSLLYEKYYPSSFKMYSHLDNEVVFKVVLKKLVLLEYENGKPLRIYFDFINKTTVKDYYEA